MIIDEGPGIEMQFNQKVALVGMTEKGYHNIKVSLDTLGGHSSIPPQFNGAGLLAQSIVLIDSNPYVPELHNTPFLTSLYCLNENVAEFDPVVRDCLNHLGNFTFISCYFIFLDTSRNKLVKYLSDSSPFIRYNMQTSQAVDVVRSGIKGSFPCSIFSDDTFYTRKRIARIRIRNNKPQNSASSNRP